jgi:quinolinate synthase
MRKGSLAAVKDALEGMGGEVIRVPADIAQKARGALRAMLEMSK